MDDIFVFTWTIENFSWCLFGLGEPIDSPLFVADTPSQTHWKLILHPKGFDGRHISCYLQRHEYNENVESIVDFAIGIVNLNGTMHFVSSLEKIRFSRRGAAGFKEWIPFDMLQRDLKKLLPGGTLTIQCHLKASPPADSFVEDLVGLSRAFQRVFELGDYNDVVLCADDLEIPAHRAILGARSIKYFQEIETNISETTDSVDQVCEIDAGEVEYDAFRDFLLYLYCGVIETTDPLVWSQLYDMAECYQLFDLKRDIFPTTQTSKVWTKVMTKNKSVVFRIKQFSTTQSSSLGRLVDLDCARVGVVFSSQRQDIEFVIHCYTSDKDFKGVLLCTVSVLDIHRLPRYTSVSEIPHTDAKKSVSIHIPTQKLGLMNDSFLLSDAVSVKLTFTVISELKPLKIGSEKVGRALCLGHEPPSQLTLNRLSKDLEYLVEMNELGSNIYDWVKPDSPSLQKAVLNAWSSNQGNGILTIQTSIIRFFQTKEDKLLYRFLCTGRIAIPNIATALTMYTTALRFGIDRLMSICHKKLESMLSFDNAAQALVLAQSHECFESVASFVFYHFEQIRLTYEWRRLELEHPLLKERMYRRLCIGSSERYI